jgi:SNF2 family DNA or RNA helicase
VTGTLRVGLAGTPPQAVFSRDAAVPDELWNALGRNIAPDQARMLDEHHLGVPIERLLSTRNWLADMLTTYDCAVELSPAVQEMLNRHELERQAVGAALSGELQDAAFDDLLAASRFQRELRDFQRRDLARLLALRHGANFSVPGAGKTTVAYALYEALREQGDVRRLLVVAPISAFDAWLTEADACFAPPPRIRRLVDRPSSTDEIVVVNYQRLSGSRFARIAEWVQEQPCHVILDEAHRMKRGRTGEWGAACLELAHLAVRRDILTGTPAPQHPSDFVALLDYLWPNQAHRILPRDALQQRPADTTMHQVSARLRPLFARTRKDELGLRPPEVRVERTEMKPIQAEIYAALRTRMTRAVRAGRRDQAALARMGAVTMYLLQAASNPALLGPALGADAPSPVEWPPLEIPVDSELGELIRTYGRHEVPAKFDKLATMVAAHAADDPPRKTLVWSNFVANLEELARVLAPFEPAVIHGGVTPSRGRPGERTREAELDRFRSDDACLVLLANPAAMSEGVSLHHSCHDAIYVDRTFNAGQYLQSLDRIHRLGLAETVQTRMTMLSAVGTLDEAVDGRLRTKAERLSLMLRDEDLVTMALPDEEEGYGEWIDASDPDDLEVLFAHLRLDE